VHILSDRESIDEAAKRVIATLEAMGLIPPAGHEDSARVDEMRRRLASLGYA
jgi:hypothetical protein